MVSLFTRQALSFSLLFLHFQLSSSSSVFNIDPAGGEGKGFIKKSDSGTTRQFSSILKVQNDRSISDLIQEIDKDNKSINSSDKVWELVKYEALSISESDIKSATIMANSILSYDSYQEAVIVQLANQLQTPLLQATQIRNLFNDVCEKNPTLSTIWAYDMFASVLKDDSQSNAVSVLLFNQGFHSLVTYRLANALWHSGRDGLSRYLQSLSSRIFGADIHPACKIGKRCVLAGGTGVVIGETAVLGDDCTISHGVTLGGTGKETGDRHPKLGVGVSLGVGSTILGNIILGDGVIVEPGSVVTKPVEPYTRVGGVPAKVLARLSRFT